MEIVKSIILGIVQGLTEFLPVSSTGHLVIIPFIFKWNYIPLYYIVSLHFATLLSLVAVFYRDIWKIIKAFFIGLVIKSKRDERYFKLSIFIIIASIPAALAGFLLNDFIESFFSRLLFIGVFLIVTAIILVSGEMIGKRAEEKFYGSDNKEAEIIDKQGIFKYLKFRGLNLVTALIIGIGQAVAILPGISRSGITISFARAFGIKREESVRFSMLLSIPVIFGAFIFEILKSYSSIFENGFKIAGNVAVSFLCSFLSGFFAIKFLLTISRKRNLNFFALYCMVIGVIIIILTLISKL